MRVAGGFLAWQDALQRCAWVADKYQIKRISGFYLPPQTLLAWQQWHFMMKLHRCRQRDTFPLLEVLKWWPSDLQFLLLLLNLQHKPILSLGEWNTTPLFNPEIWVKLCVHVCAIFGYGSLKIKILLNKGGKFSFPTLSKGVLFKDCSWKCW